MTIKCFYCLIKTFKCVFFSIRQKHMEQIAEQRYDKRIVETPECVEQSRMLGLASVTIDILGVKHSSPATLSAEDQQNGSCKGI